MAHGSPSRPAAAAAWMPNAELHLLMGDDVDAIEGWDGREDDLAAIFVGFLNRVSGGRVSGGGVSASAPV